ncbi:uncharacterized protein LOC132696719 isoform X2 [Cylas formicarius]|nr:uncharacterized protein LOC132696719 isoform X2 [Cylas formicarius]
MFRNVGDRAPPSGSRKKRKRDDGESRKPDLLRGKRSSWKRGETTTGFLHTAGTWWPWCDYWKTPQHTLFQLANVCFVLAYSSTCSKKGVLFMHCWLILGLMLFST